MSKKKELLDHITVHSWMSERMNLEYPELYVYAAFYTAGDAGILAAEYVTAKMAKLCGVSVSTFYKARNNLLIMELLYSRSFSGTKRVYYVTERKMPLPLETKEKDTVSTKELSVSKPKSSGPYLSSPNTEASPKHLSVEEEKAAFIESIKSPTGFIKDLRRVTDLIIEHRNETLSIISKLRVGMSDTMEELREMSDELHSWGKDPDTEKALGALKSAKGEKGALKECHFPEDEKDAPNFIKKLSSKDIAEMWDKFKDEIGEWLKDDHTK